MYKLVIFVLCLLCHDPASIHICKHLFLMIDQTFFSSCLLLFGSVQFFGCLFLYLRVRHPDMTFVWIFACWPDIVLFLRQIGSLSSFLYLTRVVSLSLTVWCVWIVCRLMLCGKVIQHWIVSVNDCRCAVSGNKICHTADQCLRHGVHDVP